MTDKHTKIHTNIHRQVQVAQTVKKDTFEI